MERLSYEIFKAEWEAALRHSGLSRMGFTEELLDLHSTARRYTTYVEPVGGQDIEPFHASASLQWSWGPLLSARTQTSEDDLLVQLLGRETHEVETEQPWIRVDLGLRASLLREKAPPMPTPAKWSKWVHELTARLERMERIVPHETVREDDEGNLAILAWQGEPEVKAICDPTGQLRLEGVRLSAWQAVELPRVWSDSDREADGPIGPQLESMFGRVRSAIQAWVEVLDHLR